MAVISFPSSPAPMSVEWKLNQPTQVNVSEWTGSRQALALGRGWWTCRMILPPLMSDDERMTWRAFIASCQGAANVFDVPFVLSNQTGLGVTARINGAGQMGSSLATDGWPASTTVLRAGHHVTIEGQMLRLTADAVSNGSGQATLSFMPLVRNSPPDNAIITYNIPVCRMYLAETVGESSGIGDVMQIELNLREAF